MRILLSNLILPFALLSANAADWPNWRGPEHNGLSSEAGWDAHFSADGPPRLWKTNVGTGFASMAVSGGHVFTMGNQKNVDSVYCLDAETGQVTWKYSYPCDLTPMMYEGGPSATPSVSGGQVFTLSKGGDLFCLTAGEGKVVWQKHLTKEIQAVSPSWGFAGSPLVQGDLVILDVGDAGLAVKKATGEIAWSSGGPGAGYSSPVPCEIAGAPAVVISGATQITAVRIADGKVIWRHPWKTDYDINAADAVIVGRRVFVTSGYGHGGVELNLDDGAEVWQNTALRSHINSPVALDGFVYGEDGSAGEFVLKCLDFQTGSTKWSDSGAGGSLVIVDKKIVALSDKGELMIAEASPTAFTVISRAQVLGGKCWTAPALSNGRIYCRNARGDLACFDVKKKP